MSEIVYNTEVLAELRKRGKETPDWRQLKMDHNDLIPVFVYGTLKTGGRFHGALEGCPTLGEGRTAVAYKMMSTESYPVVFRDVSSFKKNSTYHVKGEIYLVDIQTMGELDRIEGNGWLYTRKKVFIYLLDDEQGYKTHNGISKPSMECWVYFGNMEAFGGTDRLNEVSCIRKEGHLQMYDYNQYQPRLNILSQSSFEAAEIPQFLMNDRIPF